MVLILLIACGSIVFACLHHCWTHYRTRRLYTRRCSVVLRSVQFPIRCYPISLPKQSHYALPVTEQRNTRRDKPEEERDSRDGQTAIPVGSANGQSLVQTVGVNENLDCATDSVRIVGSPCAQLLTSADAAAGQELSGCGCLDTSFFLSDKQPSPSFLLQCPSLCRPLQEVITMQDVDSRADDLLTAAADEARVGDEGSMQRETSKFIAATRYYSRGSLLGTIAMMIINKLWITKEKNRQDEKQPTLPATAWISSSYQVQYQPHNVNLQICLDID